MRLFRPLAAAFVAFAVAAPAARAQGTASQAPPAPEVTAALQPFVDAHTLAGAVTLVADKDKVLAVNAVGSEDVGAKKPMRAGSLFWIASMSKPITGAALMMLVDDGKVKLDDPVEKFLPEFKELKVKTADGTKEPARKVTVRDVMSHMSGMPFSTALEKPTLDAVTLKEGAASYAATPLNTEPGTKYAYSNAGINTGGRIIEVVSGMPYEDFLDKKLFGPLGMTDTTFWPSEEQVSRLAKPYKPTADKKDLEETTIGQLKYPLTDRKRQPMPGGGLFSTAADVGKFGRMVLNRGTLDGKRYLSENAIKQMTSRQTPTEVQESYGVGWAVGKTEAGHGGALSTNLTVDFKRGLVTVFMVQHAGFPGDGGKSHGAFRKAADERFATGK